MTLHQIAKATVKLMLEDKKISHKKKSSKKQLRCFYITAASSNDSDSNNTSESSSGKQDTEIVVRVANKNSNRNKKEGKLLFSAPLTHRVCITYPLALCVLPAENLFLKVFGKEFVNKHCVFYYLGPSFSVYMYVCLHIIYKFHYLYLLIIHTFS